MNLTGMAHDFLNHLSDDEHFGSGSPLADFFLNHLSDDERLFAAFFTSS